MIATSAANEGLNAVMKTVRVCCFLVSRRLVCGTSAFKRKATSNGSLAGRAPFFIKMLGLFDFVRIRFGSALKPFFHVAKT